MDAVKRIEALIVKSNCAFQAEFLGVLLAQCAPLCCLRWTSEMTDGDAIKPDFVWHSVDGRQSKSSSTPWLGNGSMPHQVDLHNASPEGKQVERLGGVCICSPEQQPRILHHEFQHMCKIWPPPLFGAQRDAIGIDILICPVNSTHGCVVHSDQIWLLYLNKLTLCS